MNIFRMGVQRVNGRRSARCPWFHLQVSRCSFCKGHSDHLCCAHTGFTLPATHGVQARRGVVKGIDRDFWKQRARGTVHYRGICSEPDNLVLFLYRCPIRGTKAWLPWEGKKVTLHYSFSGRQNADGTIGHISSKKSLTPVEYKKITGQHSGIVL